MHFSTLFILKNKKLDDVTRSKIEEIFTERFCNCCMEAKPKYKNICDYFKFGGRWSGMLRSSKGIKTYEDEQARTPENYFSISEIQYIEDILYSQYFEYICTLSKVYVNGTQEFEEMIDKINKKEIKGVIAVLDCHE